MRSNTKLIVESWRKFLLEGSEDDPGQYSDPDEFLPELEPLTSEEEPDLSGDDKFNPLARALKDGDPINPDSPMDNLDDYDPEYNPNSIYRPGGPRDETLG